MADLIIATVLALIIGAAAVYVYKEKKKGTVCIGCPAANSCASCKSCATASCSGCGCHADIN